MTPRFFRILVIPLFISCLGSLPCYLFVAFVLKLNLPLGAHLAVIVLIYISLVVITWRIEGAAVEERERVIAKDVTLFGKTITIWVSIQFLLVVIAILAILFFYVLK